VKLHHVDFSESELENIQLCFLGQHEKLASGKYGFEYINDWLGREVPSYLEGRSGGWLTINTELTDEEIAKVDEFVASCLKAIPEFLKEEREYRANEAKEAAEQEARTEAELQADPRVMQALDLIKQIAGCDAVVMVKGTKLI